MSTSVGQGVSLTNRSGAVWGAISGTLSNQSDLQTALDAKQATGNYITALTGDVAASGPGSVPSTLATVNSNVGSFGSTTQVGIFTVNAKGLITAASNSTISIPVSAINNATISAGSSLSGSNTGDQTIVLTGDVTGSGVGSFATTIANDAVTYAKIQNVSATSRVLGRITSGAGDVEELTGANIRTISGLEAGGAGDIWVEKAGDTMTGNLIFSGSTLSIKGASTNVPDLGTTTLAEKMGNIYLGTGKDILPDNDINGMWSRSVNYGFTPDETWRQNSDELSWTGWAAYTGFVTPAFITTTGSMYRVSHNAAAKAFRYRAAATGANIWLRTRASITYVCSAGLMIDDGSGNADGEGANNFYRVYMTQATLAGPITLVEQYRTGGGAVTTNPSTGSLALGSFVGLGLSATGTRWTAWTGAPHYFGESGENVQFTTGSASFSWTPARVGIYYVDTAVDGARKGVFDWYDEATV